MLLIQNEDKPGIIGNIGVTLGKNKINIERMQVDRKKRGRKYYPLNHRSGRVGFGPQRTDGPSFGEIGHALGALDKKRFKVQGPSRENPFSCFVVPFGAKERVNENKAARCKRGKP